jgi:hypothetical protein
MLYTLQMDQPGKQNHMYHHAFMIYKQIMAHLLLEQIYTVRILQNVTILLMVHHGQCLQPAQLVVTVQVCF